MGDSLTRGSRREMFKFFNTTMETFLGKPMSAGGVHGATYWGGGYEAVIKYVEIHTYTRARARTHTHLLFYLSLLVCLFVSFIFKMLLSLLLLLFFTCSNTKTINVLN